MAWFRQQAITWTNVDPDLSRQMASLGLNELKRIVIFHHLSTLNMLFALRVSTRYKDAILPV